MPIARRLNPSSFFFHDSVIFAKFTISKTRWYRIALIMMFFFRYRQRELFISTFKNIPQVVRIEEMMIWQITDIWVFTSWLLLHDRNTSWWFFFLKMIHDFLHFSSKPKSTNASIKETSSRNKFRFRHQSKTKIKSEKPFTHMNSLVKK